MPRETITPEQRELEAAALRLIFEELQQRDQSITQEDIAHCHAPITCAENFVVL